jgi:putative multiple sugar transport system permease protein
VIAVLNNGLQLLGVGVDRVQIIKGLVLLLAVGIDVYSKRQGRPSILGLMGRNRRSASPGDQNATPIERPSVAPTNSAEETSRSQSTTPN